jgi:hypothetical protein
MSENKLARICVCESSEVLDSLSSQDLSVDVLVLILSSEFANGSTHWPLSILNDADRFDERWVEWKEERTRFDSDAWV